MKKNEMLRVTLSKNEKEGIFIIRHKFDTSLFNALGRVSGGIYNRKAQCWIFSLAHHREKIWSILKSAEIELKIEYTEENFPKLFSKEGALQKEEIDLLNKIEQYLNVRNQSGRTIESYQNAIRKFLIYFRGKNPEKLTNMALDEYFSWLINTKGYSYATLNVHISGINIYYRCITGKGMPSISIDRPKIGKKLPKAISKSEVKSMITCQKNLKHKVIIMIIYSIALRRAELIDLELRDIIWEEEKVLITGKGSKQRVCFMGEVLSKQLMEYIAIYKPKKYLIEGKSGTKYSASSILQVIKRAAQTAGIEKSVTPHMLRHSFATHMIASGTSPVHIQKILGHASIKTTMIYTHLVDEDLRNLRNPLDDLNIT